MFCDLKNILDKYTAKNNSIITVTIALLYHNF